MRAFVTGATGLLGNNLVRLLIEQGHQVKALVRSREKAAEVLKDVPIELVIGDMNAIDKFAKEMEGCDVLFHTAAYFREYYLPGDHWKTLEEININGTIKLLEAAERQDIKKAIYVSSSGVIGLKSGGAAGDESTTPHPLTQDNLYFKSKVLAEEAVQSFIKTHSLPVVLILPSWMFGPGDLAPTASGQLILDYLNKKLPGHFDGGTNMVDARDVAQAMIEAVERGKNGERYIIGGKFHTLAELNQLLEKVTKVPAPNRRVPNVIILMYALAAETYSRLTGKPILISRSGVRMMQAKLAVDSTKAIKELNAKFRPMTETLRDEVTWYQAKTNGRFFK